MVFLGAEFSSFGDADAVGVSTNKQMAVSAGSLSATQERLAKKARDYGKGEAAELGSLVGEARRPPFQGRYATALTAKCQRHCGQHGWCPGPEPRVAAEDRTR